MSFSVVALMGLGALVAISVGCQFDGCRRGSTEPRAVVVEARAGVVEARAGANLSMQRSAPCTITLDTERSPTDDEVLGLLFPTLPLGSRVLPTRWIDAGGPDRELVAVTCKLPGISLSRAAPISNPARIAFGPDREVVQVSFGTRPGMVESPAGLLALVQRSGRTVRATALEVVQGSESVSERLDGGPYALDPMSRAAFGSANAVFIEAPDVDWGEQRDSGSIVKIRLIQGDDLKDAGWVFVSRRSNGVFWRGPYRWTMTSSGLEAAGDGYVVHEHWSFTHKKTKKQSSREVARTYRLVGDHVVAAPPFDPATWPETAEWGPDAELYDE